MSRILEHEAFLDVGIEHELPALHTEYFPIRLRLHNKHDKIVSGKLLLQTNQIEGTGTGLLYLKSLDLADLLARFTRQDILFTSCWIY